jgi:hypothetical protein
VWGERRHVCSGGAGPACRGAEAQGRGRRPSAACARGSPHAAPPSRAKRRVRAAAASTALGTGLGMHGRGGAGHRGPAALGAPRGLPRRWRGHGAWAPVGMPPEPTRAVQRQSHLIFTALLPSCDHCAPSYAPKLRDRVSRSSPTRPAPPNMRALAGGRVELGVKRSNSAPRRPLCGCWACALCASRAQSSSAARPACPTRPSRSPGGARRRPSAASASRCAPARRRTAWAPRRRRARGGFQGRRAPR